MAAAKLYKPDKDVAAMLGRDVSWLRANAEILEKQYGFPPVDPAVGLRHIPSIEEWARDRNRRLQKSRTERLADTNHEENHDAF